MFYLGLIAGTIAGFFVCALLTAASRADDASERAEMTREPGRSRQPRGW
jgi:hypothetical protein